MKQISVMGILNSTPDSFSDGGRYYNNTDAAVRRVREMLAEGADSIDIGGESTRPGAKMVSVDEELERVIPVIRAIREQIGDHVPLSIDTYKARVAKEALQAGATMVNSLGGLLFEPALADVIRDSQALFIIYHIKGTPQTMQQGEIVYDDVIKEIKRFFEEQITAGMQRGIDKKQFILDPGIGFGKSMEHNLDIIRRFDEFCLFDLPLLIGVSRKGHLGRLLQDTLQLSEIPPVHDRLEAALAETAIAILHGATFVRTHDVLQTKRFVRILEELL